jgi:hypothetical protein
MAEYGDGASGQVENDSFCMDKSLNARNNKEMNNKMGYHNMADKANTPPAPVSMMGEKVRDQSGPKLPGDNSYNYGGSKD